MKILVYYVGKPRDAYANRMAEEYLERVSHSARAEMREIRPDKADPFEKHPSAYKVLLEPAGRAMDSGEFVRLIGRLEIEGRDAVFVLGGADGLPAAWRGRGDLLLSLSPMTFPHELARVMLAEQLYRAFATLRCHPYPR